MSRFFTPYLQPVKTTCLGLELKPFSLGHNILLHGVESAFVMGGLPDFSDIAISVFICSRSYTDAVKAFHSKEVHKFMAKWQKQIGNFNLPEKCALFAEYLKQGNEVPTYSWPEDQEGKSRPSTSPIVLAVKSTLQHKLNFREAELMDRPWNLCLLDWLILKELEGAIAFVDEDALAEAKKVADEAYVRLKAEGKIK